MEFGERPEETVAREIQEEYCVKPKKLQLCGVRNVLRMNGAVQTHWVAFVFVAQVNPKKVKIGEPEKMEELSWFSLTRLPKPLHSAFDAQLKMIKKFGLKI